MPGDVPRQCVAHGLAHHPPVYFSLVAIPAIVPAPNSYSLRISSKSSTLDLQSNQSRFGQCPNPSIRSFYEGGQNCRNGPIQSTELQIELGLVRPEYRAVDAPPMNAYGQGFNKIRRTA